VSSAPARKTEPHNPRANATVSEGGG
jgi:hypothetical protein